MLVSPALPARELRSVLASRRGPAWAALPVRAIRVRGSRVCEALVVELPLVDFLSDLFVCVPRVLDERDAGDERESR